MRQESGVGGPGSGRDAASELLTRNRTAKFILAEVLSLAYLFSYLATEADLPGFPLCIFHLVTGLPCPSCGFSRAFIALSHGKTAAALKLNILSLPAYFIGLAVIAALVFEAVSARSLLQPFLRRHQTAVLLTVTSAITLRYLATFLW